MTFLLTAVVSAISMLCITATQLSDRSTAKPYLARAVETLLEIDQFVLNSWPALAAAAEQGKPIPLTGYPIALQLDPAGIDDGPGVIADSVAAATASLIYDDGLAVLADSPQAFRLVSRGAVFDGTIGRLTRDGHAIATVALIVSGAFVVLLGMALVAQTRGLNRIGTPALAIGLGASAIWLAATLTRSAVEANSMTELDPFAADLWLIASDAVSVFVRNSAIVALAAGVVAGCAAGAGVLLRLLEPRRNRSVSRFR